jgi:hypothetical protein
MLPGGSWMSEGMWLRRFELPRCLATLQDQSGCSGVERWALGRRKRQATETDSSLSLLPAPNHIVH